MLSSATLTGAPVSTKQPIVIGLVNNMPDAALRATERQFLSLLAEASGDHAVHIRYFMLPGLPHTAEALSHVGQHYEDLAALWGGGIDGLIVTGTEPRAASIADEPYWESLTRLIDWTDGHVISTIWSCLAAHAAVLHLDGVERQHLSVKLSGVYECVSVEEHPILARIPERWCMPHSRHNDLAAERLLSRGYQVLSRSPDAGASLFVKRRNGLEVFLQGHPEYEPDTLLREYRRDVNRYLNGEAIDYPAMPNNYFTPEAVSDFAAFRQRALRARDPGLISAFPSSISPTRNFLSWRGPAVRIYANWIDYLAKHTDHHLAEEYNPCAAVSNPH